MKTNEVYSFIHKQIPVMILLSLFPGLGYIFLGWLNDMYLGAVVWYFFVVLISIRGFYIYREFNLLGMSEVNLEAWYKKQQYFFIHFSLFGWLYSLFMFLKLNRA